MPLPATVLFCMDFISASLSLSLPRPHESSMLLTCSQHKAIFDKVGLHLPLVIQPTVWCESYVAVLHAATSDACLSYGALLMCQLQEPQRRAMTGTTLRTES